MARPRTNNVQINIAIPGEWKKELENLWIYPNESDQSHEQRNKSKLNIC